MITIVSRDSSLNGNVSPVLDNESMTANQVVAFSIEH